jgi:DNA-binding NtrC family response regulator
VLITGPSGTGKRLIARAIHAHSARYEQPLIPFCCGQLPEPLACLQLFGHAAGAGKFTPHAALGCLGAAQGGTLLLNEVGDLDLASQDRLLQVLNEKRCAPVGSNGQPMADIRVIATSSRDLRDEVRAGRFRLKLLYSLNAISLQAQPLSARRMDIEPLVRHILARITLEQGLEHHRLAHAALALLQAYDWPDNVTQLERVLEQAVLTSTGPVLNLDDFAELFVAMQEQDASARQVSRRDEPANSYESIPNLPVTAGNWLSLDQLEAEHLRATLRQSRHNLSVAARLLGLNIADLQAKLARHRLLMPGQSTTTLSDHTV